MRAPVILASLLLAGCLAPAGSPASSTAASPSAKPVEFRPAWQPAGTTTWWAGDRAVEVVVPPGWHWASDGRTYFYATSDPAPHDEGAFARCAPMPPENGTWTLVNVSACSWERHPSVSCDLPAEGRGPCDQPWRDAPAPTNVYVPFWHRGAGFFVWTSWDGTRTNVTMPADASWATDGHTYLYATRSLWPHDATAIAQCLPGHDGYGPVIVVVELAPGCSVAAHPAVSCGGWPRAEDPCSAVTGPGPSPAGARSSV